MLDADLWMGGTCKPWRLSRAKRLTSCRQLRRSWLRACFWRWQTPAITGLKDATCYPRAKAVRHDAGFGDV